MAFLSAAAYEVHPAWAVGIALLVLTFIAMFLFGFVPRTTVIVHNELRVASPLHTWTLPLANVVRVEPATLGALTVRRAAVGWPLPPNGSFWNRRYGTFHAHTSSRHDLYMLSLRDGSRVLVSLPDAAERKLLGLA